MDLNTLATIAEWRDDSLRNARNVTMPKKLADDVTQAVRRATLKSPGCLTEERGDVYADKQPTVFQNVMMSILSLGSIWQDETLQGNGPVERPVSVAIRLTKRLFDWSYSEGRLNHLRIARGLWIEERLLKVRTFGPQDWLLTVRRLRQQAYSADMKQQTVSKQTAWDCLLAMCLETVIDRPTEPFDSCLPLCIEPDRVFEEDLSTNESIFDTVAYQMDAFGKTFSSFQWTVGAMTKIWILALADKMDSGYILPAIKKQFGYSSPKNKKDTTTIFRNMIFNFGIAWTVARDIVMCLVRKNFKLLESTVSETIQSHALQGYFPKTIDAMVEAKILGKSLGMLLHKHSILLQGLMYRLHTQIQSMTTMPLREKFVMAEFVLQRQTTVKSGHSKVFLPSNVNQTVPSVTSWTMLSLDQLGFDGILGANDDDATDIAVKLLTTLTTEIASDLGVLHHMLTHPDMWVKKKINNGLLIWRLPDCQTEDDKTSKLPNWIPSPADWDEMRKTLNTSFKIIEQMKIDAMVDMIQM